VYVHSSAPMRGFDFLTRHAVLLIVVGGGVLRFAGLGAQGYWIDEWNTLEIVLRPAGDLLTSIEGSGTNPPFYFMLAGAWERVFGDSEVGLRSLSAVLGTATIPLVYAATVDLAGRRAALIAAALTASSPLLVWYSQEARAYELTVFLSALAFLFFVRALEGRDNRWLWAWGLVSAIALATHYLTGAVAAAEAAALLWRLRARRLDVLLATGVVGIAGITLLPMIAAQRGNAGWIGLLDLNDRLLRIGEHFVAGLSAPWPWIPYLAGGILAAAVAYAVTRGPRGSDHPAIVPAGIALAAGALLVGGSLLGDDYVITRNLLSTWIPFVIALGAVLGTREAGGVGVAAAAAVSVIGVGLTIWTALTPEVQRPDWRQLASELGPPDGDRLVISESFYSGPFVLYLHGGAVADPAQEVQVQELAVIDPRPVSDYSLGTCWWTAFCGGRELFDEPPPFDVPARFELSREGTTSLFEYRVYRSPTPVDLQPPAAGLGAPRAFLQMP
jgi:MFS family permease